MVGSLSWVPSLRSWGSSRSAAYSSAPPSALPLLGRCIPTTPPPPSAHCAAAAAERAPVTVRGWVGSMGRDGYLRVPSS